MTKSKKTGTRIARASSGRVTAKEVAARLGISTMTVSRVMNKRSNVDQETRKLVLATAQELGYRPNHIAKSLVLRKTHTIGVVVPEITHSFFPEVIRGIEEEAYRSRYHLILMHTAESVEREKDAILTLESKRVDGILLSTAQSVADADFYKEVIQLGMPIVFYDRCAYGIGASCVSIDDEESARRITDHLIGHGYDPIAHLSGSQRVSIGLARLKGFRQAMGDRGRVVREDLIVEAGFHEVDGTTAMNSLLDRPRETWPRAVVAVNDPAAFGAIKAIRERNLRIPEDIALVGFSDDIRAALMPTPLTTIRQPAYEIGKLAAAKLIAVIEGKSPDVEEIVVKAEEVIRESCGCAKTDKRP